MSCLNCAYESAVNDKLEEVLFLKVHLNLNQTCTAPAVTLECQVDAFIIHVQSYICLDSESISHEKYEAVVEKNTMLEGRCMAALSISFLSLKGL